MKIFSDVVAVVGLAVIGQGIWQLSPPAALIYSGIALFGIACVLGWKRNGTG